MSAGAPIGTMPTPYGVTVLVYQPKDIDPNDPEAVAFDMDGAALMAGIYDPVERKRFGQVSFDTGRCPAFEEFGGHRVPRIALPHINMAAYPTIPTEGDFPTEAWVTGTMDRHRWCDRAEFLIDVLDQNMAEVMADPTDTLGAAVYPLGLSILLMGALEHLCEIEIDCIEAAALYAVSSHEPWRRAGADWLRPFRETWFRDWKASRQGYTNFARALGASTFNLPSWLHDDGGGA